MSALCMSSTAMYRPAATASAACSSPSVSDRHGTDEFGAEGFDGTGFRTQLPVHLKRGDGDAVLVPLNFRIVADVKRVPGQQTTHRSLMFEITSDEDLYTLYTLVVGEDEYPALKESQNLQVDFTGFAKQVVDVLRECAHGRGADSPSRFEVSLSHPSPHELASVRITTYIQFALVPFLQLSFRPGPDEAIKQLLATQIRDLKQRLEVASRSHGTAEEEVARLKHDAISMGRKAASVQAEHEAQLAKLAAEHQTAISAARELHQQDLDSIRAKHASELERVTTSLEEQRTALSARVEALTEERATLASQKFEVESTCQGLSNELEATKKDLAVALARVESTEGKHANLDASSSQLREELERARMKVATTALELKMQEGLREHAEELLAAETEKTSRLDEEVARYKSAMKKYEEQRSACEKEIDRGNRVIKKLQARLKAVQAEADDRGSVLLQQEQLVKQKESDLLKMHHELTQAREMAASQERKAAEFGRKFQAANDAHQAAIKQVESMNETVAYLNKQITDNQIDRLGMTPSQAPLSASAPGFASSRVTATRFGSATASHMMTGPDGGSPTLSSSKLPAPSLTPGGVFRPSAGTSLHAAKLATGQQGRSPATATVAAQGHSTRVYAVHSVRTDSNPHSSSRPHSHGKSLFPYTTQPSSFGKTRGKPDARASSGVAGGRGTRAAGGSPGDAAVGASKPNANRMAWHGAPSATGTAEGSIDTDVQRDIVVESSYFQRALFGDGGDGSDAADDESVGAGEHGGYGNTEGALMAMLGGDPTHGAP